MKIYYLSTNDKKQEKIIRYQGYMYISHNILLIDLRVTPICFANNVEIIL